MATKPLEMNWVGHCFNKEEGVQHDKIYIYTIRIKKSGEYELIGKWGARGQGRWANKEQVKSTAFNIQVAKSHLADAIREKQKKGYKDIAHPSYTGPCKITEFKPWFENDELGSTVLAQEESDVDFGLEDTTELIVECINNVDLTDSFDMGIKYIVRDVSVPGRKFKTKREAFQAAPLVGVEDKRGETISTSPKRFKIVLSEE